MQTLSRRSFLSGLCSCCAVLPLASCMAGKGAGGTSLSQQDEIKLGSESWQRVLQTSRPANNPPLKQMVTTATTRIINAAGPAAKGLPWEVELFENNEPNAFALPGGKVGVNTGLFNVAENEHQLATVLGHEVRHVTGHHGAKRYEQAMQTQMGLQVVSIALGASGVQDPKQVMSLLGAGANVGIILPFSRDQESEADMVGLDYMHAAGYDVRQSVPFWQRMMQAGAGNTPTFLSSHPAGQERIAGLQQRIAQLNAGKA